MCQREEDGWKKEPAPGVSAHNPTKACLTRKKLFPGVFFFLGKAFSRGVFFSLEKLFPGVFFPLERLFQGCFFSLEKPDRSNLENGDSARHDRVKVGASVRVKSAPENLHSEQSSDEDGEHEEDEEGRDAGDGVHQRLHQVAHAVPIPACHCVLGGN